MKFNFRTLWPTLTGFLVVMHAQASDLNQFVLTPNAAIQYHNDKVLYRVTAEQCASACLTTTFDGKACQSFDYERATHQCALSKSRVDASLRLKRDYAKNPHDHYSRIVPGRKNAQLGNKRLLLIGTDGIRGAALNCKDSSWTAANRIQDCGTYETFEKLIKGGAFHDNVLAGGVPGALQMTNSGTGWSSVITGHWSDEHNIVSNYEPTKMRKPHVLDLIKKGFPKATYAVVVDWVNLVQQLRPDITDNIHEYNKFYKTVHGADNPTVKKAISYLEEEEGPTALFVHIGNADTHTSYHPLSTVYKDAIGQTDKRISLILEALVKRKNYQNEDWLIVLASDHGGTGWQHGGPSNEERNAYLILNNTYDKTNAKSYCKGFLNPPTKKRPAGWPAEMRQIDGATPHILDFFGLPNGTEGRKHPACKSY